MGRLLGARLSLVNVRGSGGLTGAEPDDAPPSGPGLRVWRATSPAAGLQELITAERPVLTVLGSAHGASHGRVSLGGTAERVLTGSGCPIAVIPRGHGAPPIQSIGVGLLPSDESLRALRAGAALARAAGVPLLVFTVLRRSPDQADAALLAARLAPDAAETQAPAAEMLRAAIGAAAREGDADTLDVRPQVLVGDAADALVRASARLSLLVLGSRAYGPAGVVLPGGAARQVLGAARCPVLLVPRADVAATVALTVAP
jgi:nucleotide-binding universal stress UspA family protein